MAGLDPAIEGAAARTDAQRNAGCAGTSSLGLRRASIRATSDAALLRARLAAF